MNPEMAKMIMLFSMFGFAAWAFIIFLYIESVRGRIDAFWRWAHYTKDGGALCSRDEADRISRNFYTLSTSLLVLGLPLIGIAVVEWKMRKLQRRFGIHMIAVSL